MYPVGTTLKRCSFGGIFHYGIVDRLGDVIHNSKLRGVVRETEEIFADGKEIQISDITSDNPESAADTAERYIGAPYDLISNNCEHFVRLAHGLEVESLQLQKYLFVAAGALVAINSDNATLKSASGGAALGVLLTPPEKSPVKNAIIGASIGMLADKLLKK